MWISSQDYCNISKDTTWCTVRHKIFRESAQYEGKSSLELEVNNFFRYQNLHVCMFTLVPNILILSTNLWARACTCSVRDGFSHTLIKHTQWPGIWNIWNKFFFLLAGKLHRLIYIFFQLGKKASDILEFLLAYFCLVLYAFHSLKYNWYHLTHSTNNF